MRGPANLSNHSDSSLGIARFEHGSFQSFDTEIETLIQQFPDTPIGGYTTASPTCDVETTVENHQLSVPSGRITGSTDDICLCDNLQQEEVSHAIDLATDNSQNSADVEHKQPISLSCASTAPVVASASSAVHSVTSHVPIGVPNLDGVDAMPCCELAEQRDLVIPINMEGVCAAPSRFADIARL